MHEYKKSKKPDSFNKYEYQSRPTLYECNGPNVKFPFINALTCKQAVYGRYTTPVLGISSVCVEARFTSIPSMSGECNAWDRRESLIGITICHSQATFEPLIRWEASVMCVLLPVKEVSSDFTVIGRNQKQMHVRTPPGISRDFERNVPFKQNEGN